MTAIQLELDFKHQLQQAQSRPLETDWQQLCLAFDTTIAKTPLHQQLALAANAISEMAEVFSIRWIEQLTYSPDAEPVLSDDFLNDLLVSERPLDLSDLIAEPELYVRSPSGKSDEVEGTVVEYKDKSVVLAELESSAELEEQAGEAVALKASHEENVGAWVGAIAQLLERAEGAVSFVELVKEARLPAVAVWIGLLLSGFRVEQRGEFYEGGVYIGF